MIYTIIESIEYALEIQSEPQMDEMRLPNASEHDVRAVLEKDMQEWGEKSQFVKTADDEYALRSWTRS